uniref:Uncharacterized protein n=1 Tax=Anopheles maculatus TaxID=74869 RepID=A0A182SVK4_9DIPT
MERLGLVRLVSVITIVLLVGACSGQDILGSYFRCRNEYEIEPSIFEALRMGNFSVRNPFIEVRHSRNSTRKCPLKPINFASTQCFGECFVKRAGFMNDNFTFNRDTIMRFMSRFVSKEIAEVVYDTCTENVIPTYCVTAFEVYQCIYENTSKKWDSRK